MAREPGLGNPDPEVCCGQATLPGPQDRHNHGGDARMNWDFLPEPTKAAGLSALMKGAGMLTRWLPIPQPTLLVGPGASLRLAQAVSGMGYRRVMVVTDKIIAQLGLIDPLLACLRDAGVQVTVFDEITPDAPIPLIERGLEVFQSCEAEALIAVGGGSSIDASKSIAVASANPQKSLRQLAGYFRGLNAPAPLYAVPTTAGTGSEVTVAAVISDPERQTKLVLVDTRMVPKMAALDPSLMTGLPPAVTAATGMDALTHAVEAFIGQWATPTTDAMALTAVGLIFENLRTCYREGANLQAREKMALASTYAGIAFTRANVGYVHAIAHQFGGKYHTPHGLANAIVLPHVLRFSAVAIEDRLAELAVRAGLAKPSEKPAKQAAKFLDGVEALNAELGIPATLSTLKRRDIPSLARAALKEAHLGYPVPRYMTQSDCEALLQALLPAEDAPVKAPTKTAGKTAAPRRRRSQSATAP